MRKISLLGLTLVSLGMVLWFSMRSFPPSIPIVVTIAASPPTPIRYEQRTLLQGIANILLIPDKNHFSCSPCLPCSTCLPSVSILK